MSWFSILPQSFLYIEYWAIRVFLFLGALTIGPWLIVIIYDMVLFIFRITTYDIPYIGGRARNRPRPRAPSLSERPSGRARTFSLSVPTKTALDTPGDTVRELKKRLEKTEEE
ncbi:hypothetical protein B0O99DRAFT_683523 [Bisporella sp. PMI_857]|nr:hypothetical protein B0O99DRAFT_683523 [Bisporella sp. PMI_857]